MARKAKHLKGERVGYRERGVDYRLNSFGPALAEFFDSRGMPRNEYGDSYFGSQGYGKHAPKKKRRRGK